ncbi:unnamed protein product [Darwinula stevensoni]|uniref:DRBM domain-containing protein n=1 Tax=Darwinula stevensoni TaxID=69355 RepID=A0A7R8XIG4_9CRUS|nr:unnamed protein product [Darwinula stevensoni]CAG0893834.1 unnamed protein product [Darwinula stevensoni]
MRAVADVIARNAEDLVFIQMDAILGDLRAAGIIQYQEYLDVMEQSTQKKLLLLQETLPRRGDDAFPKFLECLRQRRHVVLADRMEREWRSLLNGCGSRSIAGDEEPSGGNSVATSRAADAATPTPTGNTVTAPNGETADDTKNSGSQNPEKNPVQKLKELSEKNGWGQPKYVDVGESGAAHDKMFIVKVVVNDKEYQPPKPGKSKKEARAIAASFCLESLV